MMVLVTGATGVAGSEVVRALLARGATVRVLVRDADKAGRLFGDTVEQVVGDLGDPSDVRAALAGAEDVVLSCSDDPRRVAWETRAIDAAAAAGVRRIVKLSATIAGAGAPAAFGDWHGRVEEHLRASGVPYVILRSGPYLSNLLAAAEPVAHAGLLVAPVGDAPVAMIDPRDVGAATAAVLSSSGHDGRTYVLTGPEAITYARVAAELTAVTGRDVTFLDVSDAAATQAMVEAGLPEVAARRVVEVFAMLRAGAAAEATTTVERLTGRRPRGITEWARDHASLFAPVPVGAGR